MRDSLVRMFHIELNSEFKPASFAAFRRYMRLGALCGLVQEPRWRSVKALEPTDRNAQFLILEGLLIEAL